MGKKNPGKSIKPVDPVALIQATTQANNDAARLQQQLNMVSSYGPAGSVRYVADPQSPGGYSQVTSFSPDQQLGYDLSNLGQNLARSSIIGTLANGVDLGKNVGRVSAPALQQSYELSKQPLQYGWGDAGDIQTNVGGDLEAARQQSIEAVYNQARSRLDPLMASAEDKMRTRLANMGFSVNDDGYRNQEDAFYRSRNDAYNQAEWSAVGAGETAAQNLFARQLGQGQFANAAQQQNFGQLADRAAFNNTAINQENVTNRDRAQFGNDAAMASFQAALAANQNAFQQYRWQTELPMAQLSMLYGTTPGLPQGVGYTPTQVNPADVMGAYALNQQGQIAKANANAQAGSGLMGGLFSLGSAAILAGTGGAGAGALALSDRRAKTDVRRIGTHAETGLPLYLFRYKHDPATQHMGLMADEVKQVRPDLVVTRPDGLDAVNYAGL